MLLRVCIATAIVGAGCDDGTAVSDISASVVARIDDGQLTVEAFLSPDYVISAGESFYVTFRGARTGLANGQRSFDDTYHHRYVATSDVDGVVQADEALTVTLERADGEVIEVTGTVPPPFTLTAPATVPGNLEWTVTWSPTAADSMGWRAFDDCAFVAGDGPIREDMGTLTFPADLFEYCLDGLSLSIDRWRTTRPETGFASTTLQIFQTQHALVEVSP